MSIFELMAAPFAECLVLVGIHTYLGIHVLRRRVIFVDLALAQTAALGTTVGFLFGILPETTEALVFSMAFTFLGASLFAMTRIRGERVPQEAIIGLVYAITAAAAVLVVEKTHGSEHLKDILVGSILWVRWSDVLTAAIAYVFIGAIHYTFRSKFLLISENPERAYERGVSVRAWDLLFYVTFGFVITFSVRVAGVLLVFVFLVAPAIMGFMITDRLLYQLLIGWVMGTVVTALGLFLSYVADVPSGPNVVVFYGVVLGLGALVLYVVRAKQRGRALGWVGVGVAVAAAVFACIFALGRLLGGMVSDEVHEHDMAEVVAQRESEEKAHAKEEAAAPAAGALQQAKKETMGAVGEEALARYLGSSFPDEKLELIQAELESNQRAGLGLLICFLRDDETPPFFRAQAVDLLEEAVGRDFGYDPEVEPAKNKKALEEMRTELLVEPIGATEDEASGQRRPRRHRRGGR